MRKERQQVLEKEKQEQPKQELKDEVDFERWYSSIDNGLLDTGHEEYRYINV